MVDMDMVDIPSHICFSHEASLRHWETKWRSEEVWKGCGEKQSSFRGHAMAAIDTANASRPFSVLVTLAKLLCCHHCSPLFIALELQCCGYHLCERSPTSGALARTGDSNFSPSLFLSLSFPFSFLSPSPLLLQLFSSANMLYFNTLISSLVPAGSHRCWWAVADLHRHDFSVRYCGWLIDRGVNLELANPPLPSLSHPMPPHHLTQFWTVRGK